MLVLNGGYIMPVAEGKRRKFLPVSSIDTEVLETFPYQMKEVIYRESGENHCEIVEDTKTERIKQTVIYETDELSALCPYSGLPDQGTLIVEYIPNKKVLELKSFKYYLMSFREVGIYQEHLTQRIYRDLKNILEPENLKVITVYNTRGGIDTTCKISDFD